MVPLDHATAFLYLFLPACGGKVLIELYDRGVQIINRMIRPDTDVMEYRHDGILFLVLIVRVYQPAVQEYPVHVVPVLLIVLTHNGLKRQQQGFDHSIGILHGGMLKRLNVKLAGFYIISHSSREMYKRSADLSIGKGTGLA